MASVRLPAPPAGLLHGVEDPGEEPPGGGTLGGRPPPSPEAAGDPSCAWRMAVLAKIGGPADCAEAAPGGSRQGPSMRAPPPGPPARGSGARSRPRHRPGGRQRRRRGRSPARSSVTSWRWTEKAAEPGAWRPPSWSPTRHTAARSRCRASTPRRRSPWSPASTPRCSLATTGSRADVRSAPVNGQSVASVGSARPQRSGNKALKNPLVFSCNSLIGTGNRFGGGTTKSAGRGTCGTTPPSRRWPARGSR